jgi:hypothetical protein
MRARLFSSWCVATLVSFLSAAAAGASGACASPAEATALEVSALRQYLMVAALTCNKVAAYNLFVSGNRDALQDADRVLLEYFHRTGGVRGDDAYNTFKTVKANNVSLYSLHAAGFCVEADAVFERALMQNAPLAELAAVKPRFDDAGYQQCLAQVDH